MSIRNLNSVFQKNTYETLYRNSEIRENLLSWFPFCEDWTVLVLGEEETSLVKQLKKQVRKLQLLTPNQLMTHGEKYDVLLQLGSIDCKKMQAEQAYEAYFKVCRAHLMENGLFLFAADNSLGLRYFAGTQDENYDGYFIGPQGYADGQTIKALSYRAYQSALRQAGFVGMRIYYPYPDYRFPATIYSEEWLPAEGECNQNIRNFDKDRYLFFEESRVFDRLMKEGLFPEFSNSYLFVAFANEQAEKQFMEKPVLYSKYSNDRAKEFQIRTDIVVQNKERFVRKCPLREEANAHVRHMAESYRHLTEENGLQDLCFCPTSLENDVVVSPFEKGVPLQKLIIDAMQQNRSEDAKALVQAYISRMRSYFAARKQTGSCMTDIDMVFSNILVDGETWKVIDYEWSFTEQIPEDFVLYRALFRASIELPQQEWNSLEQLLEMAEIPKDAAARYKVGEERFQAYITTGQTPFRDMVEVLGNQVLPFEGQSNPQKAEAERLRNLWEPKTKKIAFHIDTFRIENQKASCVGWACASIGRHRFLPVHIRIFDQEGNPVRNEIHCSERADVKQVLKAGDTFPALWGFDVMWTIKPESKYTIRFTAGTVMKEITLN